MPRTTFSVLVPATLLLGCPLPVCADATREQQENERGRIERCAERIYRSQHTEHAEWRAELEKAFPGRVTDPEDEDDYAAWYNLLARGGTEWRRDDAPSAALQKYFDKVAEYRRLGDVPSITRDEFMRYADRVLHREHSRSKDYTPDWGREADRVFRTLDRDGDGVLSREETTPRLRDAPAPVADADLNGRVDRDEYRNFFRAAAENEVEAVAAREAERKAKEEAARAKAEAAAGGADDRRTVPADEIDEETGLPKWFAGIDEDGDGQVALYEWREAGGPVEYFLRMDLDEDGLLTEAEYRRFTEREAEKKR